MKVTASEGNRKTKVRTVQTNSHLEPWEDEVLASFEELQERTLSGVQHAGETSRGGKDWRSMPSFVRTVAFALPFFFFLRYTAHLQDE
jgi:hypothetical protein